ncbi:MAG: hypothetical protein ABRQ26_02715 [Syntrophomonadaceae bacterium]
MERKAEYILKLKSELKEVDSEIGKLVIRSDKITVEIKQGYDAMETALRNQQSSTREILSESLMSGNEAWDLVWKYVWSAIKEFNSQAATDINLQFKELELSLKSKQSEIRRQLDDSEITADEIYNEIWNEVWNEFWNVIEEIDRQAAIEIKQVGEQLEALTLKKAALTTEIHELLMTGDEAWNVSKEITRSMVE